MIKQPKALAWHQNFLNHHPIEHSWNVTESLLDSPPNQQNPNYPQSVTQCQIPQGTLLVVCTPSLDRLESFLWQDNDQYNIRQVVIMLWLTVFILLPQRFDVLMIWSQKHFKAL